ncbi:hypothetical protein E2542_SST14595 [Spatholobus suberectus]|nr:hypothetical protein E2542_SST14595 [Spatholobus suberectus]
MDKARVLVSVSVLVLVCFFCVSNGNGYDEKQRKKVSLWEWQRLRSAYSAYWALFPSNIGYMLKDLVNHACRRFFPPNIDFRRGDEGQGVTAGEVVREALARSLGTSKATVEDAAKSAAETVHNVKKRTLSDNRETERQNEL